MVEKTTIAHKKVQAWDPNFSFAQLWIAVKNANGSYHLLSAGNVSMCLNFEQTANDIDTINLWYWSGNEEDGSLNFVLS